MENEKVIARVALSDRQALSVCEGIKSAFKLAGLPEDTIIPITTSTGEEIISLSIVAEQVGDVAMLYTMIANLE